MTNSNKDSRTKDLLSAASKQAKQPGFFQELWEQVRLVFSLLRDRNVPIYLKLVPFLGFAYLLLPPDIVPDFIPVLGQLDDLTIMLIGAKMFIELSPQDVVASHIARMRAGSAAATIVDGSSSEPTSTQKEPPVIIEMPSDDSKQ